MDRIDFRSDTVTWPTPSMREAMAFAAVGDDVYGEDPTVNKLEALAAEKTGKEAALFVASGTMGNLVSILAHATRGDEMIVGHDSHIMLWEAGNAASLGGVIPLMLPTDEFGRMAYAAVESSVRDSDVHLPRTRLIHVENSYGNKHGYALPVDYFYDIKELADRHGLRVHLDGARLFNAAVALGVDAREITRHVDSVTFCLSKGLCAPVGSVVCGPAAFIAEARRMRKAVGGGMRQAGILAAAGIIALEEMIDRLLFDHLHAAQLAAGLTGIPGLVIDSSKVCTNMVFFDLADDVPREASDIVRQLQEEANVWLGTHGQRGFRAVSHYWVGISEIETLLQALRYIMSA